MATASLQVHDPYFHVVYSSWLARMIVAHCCCVLSYQRTSYSYWQRAKASFDQHLKTHASCTCSGRAGLRCAFTDPSQKAAQCMLKQRRLSTSNAICTYALSRSHANTVACSRAIIARTHCLLIAHSSIQQHAAD
jgi:hypothetical protein